MTGKDLQKLRRQELLQLLLEQSREVNRLQEVLEEASQNLQQMEESNHRLGARLREKDALNEKLYGRLEDKKRRVQELEKEIEEWKQARAVQLKQSGTVAEASLRLSGIFDTAQQAADSYLYNVRIRCEEKARDRKKNSGNMGGPRRNGKEGQEEGRGFHSSQYGSDRSCLKKGAV